MRKESVRHLFLEGIAHLPVPTRPMGTPPRILLLRPDHLGDILFMTPALHTLRAALPDAHIACLVGPWAQPILAHNADLDELLTCDFPWFNRRPKVSLVQPYAALWREAARLRRQRFDVALIMRFDFWWGAALARLAAIPRRIGYARRDVQPFLTDAVPYQPGQHEAEQNMRLVEAFIADSPFLPSRPWQEGQDDRPVKTLHFTITAGDSAWAAEHLAPPADSGYPPPDARPLIAIHPGAGAAVKLWSAEGWVTVATALSRRYGATIVFTGGAGELPLVRAIAGRLTVPHIVLAGQTTLGQLAAVFARCRLALGPDSGPLHLAVAVGTPTVHLFGPADPGLFGPWGNPTRHTVVQARYFDIPCRKRPCNRLDYTAAQLAHHACMQTITVDDVLDAVQRIYR